MQASQIRRRAPVVWASGRWPGDAPRGWTHPLGTQTSPQASSLGIGMQVGVDRGRSISRSTSLAMASRIHLNRRLDDFELAVLGLISLLVLQRKE